MALLAVAVLPASCGKNGPAAPSVVDETDKTVKPDYFYLINAGKSARIRAGIEHDMFPSRLEVNVGEVIRIENQDTETANVGPFIVPAGTVLTQRFKTPGTFIGACSLNGGGTIELIVKPK
jgi:hypothetical protein